MKFFFKYLPKCLFADKVQEGKRKMKNLERVDLKEIYMSKFTFY